MHSSRFLKAIRQEPVDRPPVWVLRQAGRYDPEFQALRAQCPDFMAFCKQPELACQATLIPIKKFQFDAAIIFSDILTLPHAAGQTVHFEKGIGPILSPPIRTSADYARIGMPDMEQDLGYVGQAIRMVKPELSVPLIGFSGSPWTLACYMIEGRGKQGFKAAINATESQPKQLETLIQQLTDMVIDYLSYQAECGADCLMLFDSWASLLPPDAYRYFSLEPLKRITQTLKYKHNLPIILYARMPPLALTELNECHCDVLGLDEFQNIKNARQLLGPQITLQGNLAPQQLLTNPKNIETATLGMLKQHPEPGYIANLGHGILPETPIENLQAFVNTVQNYTP
ncbi:MAG TPA: uroporphyrinogen decarboxylase [Gammaproteobacteria bacterium]|nr:uroporphyrinogen decarboxylase [Gammaproteobacteria bacterium]